MLAVMIAPTMGVDPMDPMFIITLVGVVAVSSFGVAGVGGGGDVCGADSVTRYGFSGGIGSVTDFHRASD